jgi:hypothetical protein
MWDPPNAIKHPTINHQCYGLDFNHPQMVVNEVDYWLYHIILRFLTKVP